MIEFKNVSKVYGDNYVLKEINFVLPSKGLVVIKGRNGSGKTTLVNLISAVDIPTDGTIYFNNKAYGSNEEELRSFREKNIGIIFQNYNLFENMTVRENIVITGTGKDLDKIVSDLNIAHLLDKKVSKLSGGEQQRVAIARAIYKDAKIIVADEPTAAIDYDSKDAMMNLFRSLGKDCLVVVVSHDIDLIEEYGDITIELDNGHIISFKGEIGEKTVAENGNYLNNFNFANFTIKNLFANTKQLTRNCILLLLSFLFMLLATSVSTLNYNDMQIDTMILEGDGLIIFNKNERYDNRDNYTRSTFTEDDVKNLNNAIGAKHFEVGRVIYIDNTPISFKINNISDVNANLYYKVPIRNLYFININDLEKIDIGRKPAQSNEIVISSYLAEQMVEFGVLTVDGNYFKPESMNDLIKSNKKILLGNKEVIVVGIKDLKFEKYNFLKNIAESSAFELFREAVENNACDIYVLDEFFDLFQEDPDVIDSKYSFSYQKDAYLGGYSSYDRESFAIFSDSVLLEDGSLVENLEKNEVIINSEVLKREGLLKDDCIGKTIAFYIRKYSGSSTDKVTVEATIVGVSNDDKIYFNKEKISEFISPKVRIENVKVYVHDRQNIKKIFSNYRNSNAPITIKTDYTSAYANLAESCKIIVNLFTVLAVVFIMLSILYTRNYMLNSIDNHRKQIAILKSLGIKDLDILKSFTCEIGVMTIVSYIFSIIAFLVVRIIINGTISKVLSFKTNIVPIDLLLILVIVTAMLLIDILIAFRVYKKIKYMSPQVLYKKEIS